MSENWADRARPFMASVVASLGENTTQAELVVALSKQGVTSKDFVAQTVVATLKIVTQQNWALLLFEDRLRAAVDTKADDLAAIYGGYDEAAYALFKQEIDSISAGLTAQTKPR